MWYKMSKSNLLLTLLTASLLGHALPALAQAPPVQPATVNQTLRLEGRILDAHTHTPLQGVYIRQKDVLNAVFSDDHGHFVIELASGTPPLVSFDAEGYETVTLPFSASQNRLEVNLQPLAEYTTELPPAHSQPDQAKPSGIFGNQFTAFYQADYTLFSQQNVQINGLVLNELGLSTDISMFAPLMFRGRFFKSRMPVDIANFPFSPAFFINHAQAKVGLGALVSQSPDFEMYLGGDVLYDNRSPDNRNNQDQNPVAFTGSLLDSEQNRVGVGLNAAAGWKLNERFTLYPEATLYPAMINIVTNSSPHYMIAGDIGARLKLELVRGVSVVGSYYTQLWYSFGPGAFENNHFFNIGLSIDPWSLAAGQQ